MTFDELTALLQDANAAAQKYLETKSAADLAIWRLAAWRIGFRAECSAMTQRAKARLEGKVQ
jgi:hypothetical protein